MKEISKFFSVVDNNWLIQIDDDNRAIDMLWSSSKIGAELDLKVNVGEDYETIINGQAKLDAAIADLKGSVSVDGNTLYKLRQLIAGLQALVSSNDLNLDTVQEIVNYIKANKTLIESVTTTKLNITDVINDFAHTDINKAASAFTVYQLYHLILTLEDILKTKVDVVDGMGLSSNDFTTEYKDKLKAIVPFTGNAEDIEVDASTFQKNLTVDEDNVQKALNKIDSLTIEADSNSIVIHDAANNFTSSVKSIENIFIELITMISRNSEPTQKFLSTTYNQNFENQAMLTIFDFNSIEGTLLNSIVDIINTSTTSSMTYQFLINSIVTYQGIIPIGKQVSFETQRTNLIIQIVGAGNIIVDYKYIQQEEIQ